MKNGFRQKLHLEPPHGWLNDPNGLCYFKGEYHIYFQYSPDSADGSGRKCWGHFKSPDLLRWTFTGPVLFPDTPDDRDGVFSGSGLVKNGTLYLFYTGNVLEEGDHDYITSGRGANVMLVTTENGHDMSPKRTLLRSSDYPDYCSCHVRDPKVWEENGRYCMVLGARTLDSEGCVLYYVSDDLLHWDFVRVLMGSDGSYMWECPDEFVLGGRGSGYRYLSVSPQGIPHQKYVYQNVYSSGFFDIGSGRLEHYREWDCGFDFYAPQTFDAPDGRKILIGWEGIGDIPYTNATTELGWQHCLTLPRKLSLNEDGELVQQPVRELERLRRTEQTVTCPARIRTSLPFELCAENNGGFRIELSDILVMKYNADEFSLSFVNDGAGCGRDIRYARISGCRDIRVIADMSSIEIYLAGGERVLSSRMYPSDTDVTLTAEGIDGTLYELNGMDVFFGE